MLSHETQYHGELDGNGLAIGNTNPLRPIDTKSVGRCSHVLSEEEMHDIDTLTFSIQKKIDEVFYSQEVEYLL